MATKRCMHCGMTFILRPQNPNQTYCNAQACQRARKRQWQKDKLHSDLDYRINQRAAQQTWALRNPDYWRHYRDTHLEYQHHQPPQGSRLTNPHDLTQEIRHVKMDACDFLSGLYLITRHPSFPARNGDSWIVEITPVSLDVPAQDGRVKR